MSTRSSPKRPVEHAVRTAEILVSSEDLRPIEAIPRDPTPSQTPHEREAAIVVPDGLLDTDDPALLAEQGRIHMETKSAADLTVAFQRSELSDVAATMAFRAMRPRLVVSNDALARTVPIVRSPFRIGRQKSEGSERLECELQHAGVSGLHAVVVFMDRRFYIEDRGSANHTYLDNELLLPLTPRELCADAWLRFGSVEALFVVDQGADGRKLDPERYRRAGEVLVLEEVVTHTQLERASNEVEADGSGKVHPGEVLVRRGIITPRQWIQALEKADVVQLAALMYERLHGRHRVAWLVVQTLAATILASLIAILAGRL